MLLKLLITMVLVLMVSYSPLPKFDKDSLQYKFQDINLTVIDESLSRYYMNYGGDLPSSITDARLPELQNLPLSQFTYTRLSSNTYTISVKDKSGRIYFSPNSNKALPPYSP